MIKVTVIFFTSQIGFEVRYLECCDLSPSLLVVMGILQSKKVGINFEKNIDISVVTCYHVKKQMTEIQVERT